MTLFDFLQGIQLACFLMIGIRLSDMRESLHRIAAALEKLNEESPE